MPRLVHAEYHWRTQSRPHWIKRIKTLESSLVRYSAMSVLTVRQQAAVLDATAEIKRLKLHLKVQR